MPEDKNFATTDMFQTSTTKINKNQLKLVFQKILLLWKSRFTLNNEIHLAGSNTVKNINLGYIKVFAC